MTNLYTQRESNVRKTWFLMTMSLVLVIFVGWLISLYFNDVSILYIAIIFSIVMNFVAYWQSDKIALSLTGAKPISHDDNQYLYHIVENLCITSGLPVPKIYTIQSEQINAFATGRDPKHAAIAVTTGAIKKLENEELEGVLAHELSHIANRDILVSTVVVVLAGIITMIADWFFRFNLFCRDDDSKGNALGLVVFLVVAILAPVASTMIQYAVSRKREYLADASGSLLTRYPDGLANALEKIASDSASMPKANTATAHLFLVSPLSVDKPQRKKITWLAKLFMTHPPLEERIKILRGMRV